MALTAITLVGFGAAPRITQAIVIGLEPAQTQAMPGDAVSINLTVSGLNAGGPDSLGDYDIDVAFDQGALTFDALVLSTALGDVTLGDAIDDSDGLTAPGILNVTVVSLLESDLATCIFCIGPYLDDIQSDAFTLATFDFTVAALPAGSSTVVSIATVNAVGDSAGVALPVDSTTTATITNPGGVTPQPVPEPSIPALAALAGLILASRRVTAKDGRRSTP